MANRYTNLSESSVLEVEEVDNSLIEKSLLESEDLGDIFSKNLNESLQKTSAAFVEPVIEPVNVIREEVVKNTVREISAPRKPQLSMANLSELQPSQDTDYTNNVQTLITLVNSLPEGVTKQTGAQIIRLTMEAMGIAMEEVLSEAQSAQSEMLDAVRGNIKKIEEYKTVIRKLENDIKHFQGKANELSEIIDLFILSSSSKLSD
jgi:hypothetical protein